MNLVIRLEKNDNIYKLFKIAKTNIRLLKN